MRCSGPHETALRQPAPSPSFLHSAALRSVTSAPAEVSPGPPLRPAGCRARLNRRPNHGSRYAWCRGGGSAIPLPLVALRLRSRSLPAARSAWPGARERPRGSASLAQPRGQKPSRPAEMPARTPSASLRLEGCAHAVADRSGPALLSPRLKLRALAVAAPRVARCGHGSRSPLRYETRTARPALRSGPLRAASPGARTKTSS